LIRNAFSATTEDVFWLRFFPRAVELASIVWPTLELVTDAFASAGFRVQSVGLVSQVSAGSIREYVDRIRARADSTLQLLSDQEFDSGVAELDRIASLETAPQPVVDRLHLVVLR